MDRPPRRSYARKVGVLATALALALTTACSQGASASWRGPAGTVPSGEAGGGTRMPPSGELKITPAADATEISVLDPITVSAQDATLETVTVTNPEGKPVQGEFDADKRSWRATERLGYGKEYTVAAVGTGSKGDRLEQTSRFSTLKPKEQTLPYLRASDAHMLKERSTYGIGQTIQVYFDEKVPDKAAAQRLLEVKTDPPVEGAWHWYSAQQVHWRPAEYFKPGTTVTVKANVYGKDLGGGVYGQSDVSASFKIGQSKVAIADANTKRMKVYIGGEMVRDIPVSLGKGGWHTTKQGKKVHYWTYSGPHVVLDKTPNTRMRSASYGVIDPKDPEFYDEDIKLTTRLTNTGVFTHLATWNIPLHGRANSSHGCINIGPRDAQWFYDTFDRGDVVDIKNTPVRLEPRNGNGDWTMSWEQWKKGSAL